MNIPGMPAGMGGQTQRVCQGDDPERRAASDKDQKDCKVTDKKQTATRTTITMQCKQGTMTVDQQYNAARTEFKGSMQDEQQGRRLHHEHAPAARSAPATCSRRAQGARREDRGDEEAARRRDGGGGCGAKAACRDADQAMRHGGRQHAVGPAWASYGQCYKKTDAKCKSSMDAANQMSPEIAKSCNARVVEFCKRYQTQEGFLKAKADENGGADVRRHHRVDQGGAMPESRAKRVAGLPRRLLPGGSKAHRAAALRRARLHLQDGRASTASSARRTCANADFEKPQSPTAESPTDSSEAGRKQGHG